ncbi:glutamate-5-semialdehyde dehydrogenase [Aquibacillus halophilus]|uniref:Gamma-glutamyl phosphate reductase n=1 Tax=Aquibacillus halophilus TaxID=930132 RepID=A0A6A8DFK6_9BACI|nr:glutamate-5-semialdehyde dehydrogenase [Aquibacillus halophilus]
MSDLMEKAKKVKQTAVILGKKSTDQKNSAIILIADQLEAETSWILDQNKRDIDEAKQKGFHDSLIDRLILTEQRITEMADALRQLVHLTDPTGVVLESWERPNGLQIEKIAVPLGVVGMIYEARPNVTVDAASLCLKTGNAVLLRGSSSALYSNKALVEVIQRALSKSELPKDAVQLIEDTSRETASNFFKLKDYLDVLIPRGGKKLIKAVVEQSVVPVIETGAGNCHIFIDQSADVSMAIDIIINAKTQRPSVCNAIETVIVDENWASIHMDALVKKLQDKKVELRVDEKILQMHTDLVAATEEDWETEYLDEILAIKTVSNINEAIEHINKYGSRHSEGIITNSEENVVEFFNSVDAAVVYHNASTRFTDGFEFGFGAEIGISTQKLHARGPMGLQSLTSTKYQVRGIGQIKNG